MGYCPASLEGWSSVSGKDLGIRPWSLYAFTPPPPSERCYSGEILSPFGAPVSLITSAAVYDPMPKAITEKIKRRIPRPISQG